MQAIPPHSFPIAERSHLQRLGKSTAYGHQHDVCLTGTRVKTLDTIRQWANNDRATDRIFCLLDRAGMGKSTVAKSMVKEWEDENRLIARFFFSRDTQETMSTREFCSTISDAFASLDRDFKAHVTKFKEERLDFKHLSLEKQFEGLVARPLEELGQRAIVIIDALDECEDRRELLEIIRTSQSSVQVLQTFVTGRPEPDIKAWANRVGGIRVESFESIEGRNEDVENYIESRLNKPPEPPEWPDLRERPDLRDRVKRRANGLFIWARIACDLLLDAVMVDEKMRELEDGSSNDRLETIYRVALEQAIPNSRSSHQATIMVLQMVLTAKSPLSIAELEELSPWRKKGVVKQVVTRLGSLLVYRGEEDPVRLLHITIREFLTSRERAGIYYIHLELGHYWLASGTLHFLRHQLSSDTDHLERISERKDIPI